MRGQSPLDVLRADSVPELVVRLVQGGELEITEKGGWKTVNFEIVWGRVVDSLGLMGVFKCSMVWSSVCGDITTSFCGLLVVNGCIQMLDGVE